MVQVYKKILYISLFVVIQLSVIGVLYFQDFDESIETDHFKDYSEEGKRIIEALDRIFQEEDEEEFPTAGQLVPRRDDLSTVVLDEEQVEAVTRHKRFQKYSTEPPWMGLQEFLGDELKHEGRIEVNHQTAEDNVEPVDINSNQVHITDEHQEIVDSPDDAESIRDDPQSVNNIPTAEDSLSADNKIEDTTHSKTEAGQSDSVRDNPQSVNNIPTAEDSLSADDRIEETTDSKTDVNPENPDNNPIPKDSDLDQDIKALIAEPAQPDPAPPKKTRMVHILTESRSGSTWLMDLVTRPNNTLTFFEPLNTAFYRSTRLAGNTPDGINEEDIKLWRQTMMSRICSCDLYGKDTVPNNMGSVNGIRSTWIKSGSGNVVVDFCKKRGTITVPKTIRLYNISELEILEETGCDTFKIIHLIRDPRAILLSRMITFHELYDGNHILGEHILGGQDKFSEIYMRRAARDLCSHGVYNYKFGSDPPAWLKGRYMLQRYEDIALSPDKSARNLFKYIGMPYSSDVRDHVYASSHATGKETRSSYSVKKDSAKVLEVWHLKLNKDHQRVIEEECAEFLELFGYKAELINSDADDEV